MAVTTTLRVFSKEHLEVPGTRKAKEGLSVGLRAEGYMGWGLLQAGLFKGIQSLKGSGKEGI